MLRGSPDRPHTPGHRPGDIADGASCLALAEEDLPAAGGVLAYVAPASSVDALPLPMSQIVTPSAHVRTYLGKRPRVQKVVRFSCPETITIVFDGDQPPSLCTLRSDDLSSLMTYHQGAPHFPQTRSILKTNAETDCASSSTASDDDDDDIDKSFEDLDDDIGDCQQSPELPEHLDMHLDSLNDPDPLALGHYSDESLRFPDWLE